MNLADYPAVLSSQQCRQVDRYAIEVLGFPGILLMENAGRGCVDAILRRVARPVAVVAVGPGNNGGDGLVIARHLQLRGFLVEVVATVDLERLAGDAAVNARLAKVSGIPIRTGGVSSGWDRVAGQAANVFVDALLGTGARGAPRSPMAEWIEAANQKEWLRVAIDVPSGLDADTGVPRLPTVRADLTCTMIASKTGFQSETAAPFVGEVEVVGIGIGPAVIAAALANEPMNREPGETGDSNRGDS